MLLQKNFFSLLLINLQLPLLDCFLVHLRHIAQKQSLLPDLPKFCFERFNFFVLQLKISLVIGVSFQLVDLLLDLLDVSPISNHEFFVFLLEGPLKAEIHKLDHLVKAIDLILDLFLCCLFLVIAGARIIVGSVTTVSVLVLLILVYICFRH